MTATGFNAMGLKVPANRKQKGYELVKTIISDTKIAWSIVNNMANCIETDRCIYVTGDNPIGEISRIDLTARYMVLSAMLTD